MKNSLCTTLFVFLSLIFVACGGSEGSGDGGSGGTGSIYGVVTDKATGESIINASVELKPVGLRTVTGSDGQFEFNEVATGTYTLYVTKTGYSDNSSDITVESGKQSKGDIQLEKLPAALRIVDDRGKDIDELDFGAEIADVSRQFNIFNDGTEKIKWKISFSSEWIESVSEESGELKAGGTQGVIVNIDRNLLESGENKTTIHVTSNDGNKQLTVKATNATVLPTLNTLEATNITSSSAVLNAEILTKGVPSYSKRGFVYALESNPTLENTISDLTAKVSEENLYSATATGLELGETYYVRGYAINEAGVAYSTNEMKFSPEMDLPNVTTEEATNINLDSESATFNGTIVDEGDPAYTERGFVYGFTHNPSVENTKIEVIGSGLGKFSANVTELEVGSIYYIRAYAINDKGVAYGTDVKLDLNGTVPQVKTEPATDLNIGAGTAIFHGEIVSVGDPTYTERGFVYGHDHNPTVEDDNKKEVTGNGEGAFSVKVTELEINTIYYIRAYATNAVGTFYGDEVILNFSAIMPVVNTSAVTSINLTAGTATLNGSITSVGDPAYTERGFVYATIHNPTVEDNTKKVAAGSGTGTFSANVSGLVLNTTYYIRAYAKSSQGTAYGSEISLNFKGTLATVKTSAATNVSIGSKTATFNGSVENVGNPAYTERGFVYATVHNPTIEDNTKKIASGSGTGAFYVNVTNLTMNQIYYIRAYATNLQGTAYGSEVTLNFNAIKPTVTTSAVTSINIGAGSATFNGKITSTGDPSYTERGFVYSLAQNPTINDTKKVVSGSGTGAFSVNVTGLVMNKIYYIRAYAKNDGGTAYGDEVSVGWHECGTANITPCIDSTTNLIWSAKSDSRVNYWLNNSYCNDLDEGGYNDWRYPNIDELRSLSNCANTGLGGSCKVSANTGCLSGNNCWSSDTCGECGSGIISKFGDSEWIQSISPRTEGNYWLFDFSTGKIDWYRSKYYYDGAWRYNTDAYVRCVR